MGPVTGLSPPIRLRPSYFATPHITTTGRAMKTWFDIYEYRAGEGFEYICRISNRGDRLNNILKRGIPLVDAMNLFYMMDGDG